VPIHKGFFKQPATGLSNFFFQPGWPAGFIPGKSLLLISEMPVGLSKVFGGDAEKLASATGAI
jgi:hypothetical protein